MLFAEAGTYVLQLDASDGELTGSDPSRSPSIRSRPSRAGACWLTLSAPGPMPLGAEEYVTATLLDASAMPIPQLPAHVDRDRREPGDWRR